MLKSIKYVLKENFTNLFRIYSMDVGGNGCLVFY